MVFDVQSDHFAKKENFPLNFIVESRLNEYFVYLKLNFA